jgi:hypothetical protein
MTTESATVSVLDRMRTATSGMITTQNAHVCMQILKDVGSAVENVPYLAIVGGVVSHLIKIKEVCRLKSDVFPMN